MDAPTTFEIPLTTTREVYQDDAYLPTLLEGIDCTTDLQYHPEVDQGMGPIVKIDMSIVAYFLFVFINNTSCNPRISLSSATLCRHTFE